MTATITEIAKKAKVSKGLVSRLLRDDPTLKVAPATRDRVMQVKRELGGLRVRARRGGKLANNVVMPVNFVWAHSRGLQDMFDGTFYHDLDQTLQGNGFRLSISFFQPDRPCQEIEKIIATPNYCDGLVLPTGFVDERLAEMLLSRGYPHASYDPVAERLGLNTVYGYPQSGFRQAVRHLRKFGHERIGYVAFRRLRYLEFLGVIAEEGFPTIDSDLCEVSHEGHDANFGCVREHARQAFGPWWNSFDGQDRPTAVMCANDYVALGVVDAMQDMGLVAGKDLSVVGYDNMEQRGPAKSDNPILTTIDNPLDVVGRRLAESLLNQILGRQREIVHEHLSMDLVVRSSTGPRS